MSIADGVGLVRRLRLRHSEGTPHLPRRDRGDSAEFRCLPTVEDAFAVEQDLFESFGRGAGLIDRVVEVGAIVIESIVDLVFVDDRQRRGARVLTQPAEEVLVDVDSRFRVGRTRVR